LIPVGKSQISMFTYEKIFLGGLQIYLSKAGLTIWKTKVIGKIEARLENSVVCLKVSKQNSNLLRAGTGATIYKYHIRHLAFCVYGNLSIFSSQKPRSRCLLQH